MRTLRSALRRSAVFAAVVLGLFPLLVVLLPSSAAFTLLGAGFPRQVHVVVSQADDCADALRLARRLLAREIGRGRFALGLVVLSDSAVAVRFDNQEVSVVLNGIRRNVLTRWLAIRGQHRTPVLISRPTPTRDVLRWLDPASSR